MTALLPTISTCPVRRLSNSPFLCGGLSAVSTKNAASEPSPVMLIQQMVSAGDSYTNWTPCSASQEKSLERNDWFVPASRLEEVKNSREPSFVGTYCATHASDTAKNPRIPRITDPSPASRGPLIPP